MKRQIMTCAAALALAYGAATVPHDAFAADDAPAARSYYAYVACESEDEVALVKLEVPAEGKPTGSLVKRIRVGVLDIEIEGPHGLAVSPDGKYWYLSMAHGKPFGTVYKYTTGNDKLVGEVILGLFPATMQVSPATGLLHVVNFNLHGDMKPSSVSVVDPDDMVEVARVTTGVMPHGSRFAPDGLHHYSLAMMSHDLFEIDSTKFNISRKMKISPSAAGKKAKPTWVQLHPHKPLAYVACNGSNEVVEIDLKSWKITRRFATGAGPYNVEVTSDGKRLVITYKSAAQTGIWDLASGRELAAISNSRAVSHGIAITPDDRFALVTAEGKGSEPGSVDIIDLKKLEKIGTIDVGKQAGGIAFWKMQ